MLFKKNDMAILPKSIVMDENMQNLLNDNLKTVLQADPRCMVDGELNKVKVEELSLEMDSGLLKLLLADPALKKHFFTPVDDIQVFDKIKFQRFINNKSFLPDSYTAYKNKIGLTDDKGNFISESREVVLSWPHKDCILEGGQDKEDAKRDEIFFNEILAPDQIDHLLEPKALTNFKKYDANGEHVVSGITYDDNLLIKGNNLLALHSLEKVYAGKVKLIYIDPPYNTGNDSFGYNDRFNRSTWLTFMRNRLVVAKKLLSPDGLIFVQCDDNEQAYLKVLLDEVFAGGFVNCIVPQMSNMSGNKIEHAIQGRRFPKIKEYILLYANNISNYKLIIPKEDKKKWDDEYNCIIPEMSESDFKNLKIFLQNGDENKINTLLSKFSFQSVKSFCKEQGVELVDKEWLMANAFRIFATKPNISLREKALQIETNNPIEVIRSSRDGLKLIIGDFNRETPTARIEVAFAIDYLKVFIGDIWPNITTTGGVAQEGGVVLKNGKKPEELIERIIACATQPGDLVLDYHCGSGTTAAVSHKMGRKFIGIEQIDAQIKKSAERLNNVINGEQSGASQKYDWQGGGSFIYCELAKCNQSYVDQVMDAKDDKALTGLLETIKDKGFISYKVDKDKFDGFEALSFDNKKKFLIELLDKNMLYVNLSEIEDKDHGISDKDIQLNRLFYSLEKQQQAFAE